MKRVISILLVALMLFGMLPSTAVHSHAAESNEVTMSIYANKGTLSGKSISWNSGVITFTNNQASSSTAIRTSDSDHYRIYQKSSVEIACSGGNITKVVVTCTSSTYATAFKNSVGNIATVSGSTVTITPTTPTDVISIASFTAQSRINQIVVTYVTETAACEHTNTTTTTVDATCTEDGSVTVTCDDCGETVSTETIDALGHNYQLVGGSYVCQNNCGIDVASYTVSFSVPAGVSAVESLTTDLNGQVTLPPAGVPTGERTYFFAGWTTETVEDSTTAPTIYESGDSFAAQDDITLKAVYTYTVAGEGGGNGNYVKVTEEPDDWSGDYLIVYETSGYIFNGSLASFDAVNNYKTVTITNNTISASEGDPYKFTITPSGTGYAIQGTSGGYIGHGSNANGLTTGASALVNSISLDKDGNANVVGSAGAYLRFNSTSGQTRFRYFKSSTYTSQKAIALYVKQSSTETTYYTTEISAVACEHVWNSGVQTSAPSCDVAGLMTYTCTLCSETKTEAIDPLGHTEDAPVTENEVEASCEENGSYDTVVYCSVCNKELSRVTTTVEATGHNFSGGTCTECGAVDESAGVAYVLVTDVNDLKVGDQIVIVAQNADYAMSATQGNNNRGQIAIEKNTSDNTVEISDAVQVLTLESGNIEGTFAFYTGAAYLYAASSSSNYLRTETILSDNSSWLITIDTDGTATVEAQGTNTRNLLRYNSTSSLFSCYASGQQDIAIYKKTVLCAHTNTTEVARQEPTCTAVGYTDGVYCNDCESYISGHEVIDMIDHSWNDGVQTTAPGCETTGVMTYICSACGETKTEEIAATGHTMNEGVVIDPTCENAGSKTYTCTVCGKEQVETIAALGHSWGEGEVITAATCDAAGEMSYTCGNDPSHTKTEEIPALGHKWDAGVQTTPPTCVTAGVMTYTCENDEDHTKTEAIPALGHNYNTEGVCLVCSEKVERFQMVTDFKDILSGGQFVLAVKHGDTYYAMDTDDFGSDVQAVEVTVNENGADSWVQWDENIPVWNVGYYFINGQNCFTISCKDNDLKDTYLTYSGSGTSFGSSKDDAYAWTFANKDAAGVNEYDNDFAVTDEDGVVSFYTVSQAVPNRAINYVDNSDIFRVYSTNNNFDTVCFFKLVKAADAECTVTFMENGEQTMTQTVANGEVISLPKPANDTLPEGYTDFVGWVTLPYMETLIAPTDIYYVTESAGNENTTLAVTDDMTLHALYSRTDPDAEGQSMSYHRVTNQNQISVGQYYIIVGYDEANDKWLAMSLDQYNDARGGSVVKADEEGVISVVPNDRVASFRLEQGFNTNTYGFFDVMRNQFLSCAAATETNNSLRSAATLGETESFTIEINADSSYSIISRIKDELTYLVLYNTNDNKNPLFSCYDVGTGIDTTKTYLYVGQTNTVPGTYYATGTCIHNWDLTAQVEATCEHAGYTQYTCSICGEIKLEDVQAHGHTVGAMNPTIEPTCTTTGLAVGYCTACEKEFEEILPATGHNFGDWTVEKKPSFTASGIQEQSCLNSNCDVSHEEEIAQLPFPVYSYGVTLGNSIGETFLIDPAYTQDATVTFTVAGKNYTYDVQKMETVYDEDKDIYYPTASIRLASGQMTDAIHVVIDSPENGTATKDYTVYEYAQYILNGEYSEKTKTLVREMLNYGNYAQIYFEYNMDDLANKDLDPVTPAEMPALDANNNKAEQTDNAENVDFFGCSLVHWFQTSINFYFKFSGNIESYEFSVNGEIKTPEVKGNMCFVTVAGFNPQNLSEDVTIIVKDGTGELSVTYSPMDYITRMYYNSSAPVELKNLVQAMYGYHLAAVAYKTNSEN